MREKYIVEKYPRYFEFGCTTDGKVNIASIDYATIALVDNKADAELLIEQRDSVLDMLVKVVKALYSTDPELFEKTWY